MPTKKSASKAKTTKKTIPARKVKVKKTENAPADSAHTRAGRLIDDRLVDNKPDQFPVLMGFIAFVFLLVVVAVVGYFFLYQQPPIAEDFTANEIIVPEISVPVVGEEAVLPPDSEVVELPVVEVERLEITNTPTGFLNVRTGPGTGFEKIGEISPGEVYNILQYNQEVGWYEIDLGEGNTGWVVRTYVNLL